MGGALGAMCVAILRAKVTRFWEGFFANKNDISPRLNHDV